MLVDENECICAQLIKFLVQNNVCVFLGNEQQKVYLLGTYSEKLASKCS